MVLFRLLVTFQNQVWDGKEVKDPKRAPEGYGYTGMTVTKTK